MCSSCFWNYKFILRFCHLFLNRFVTKMDLSQEGEKKDLAREISKYMCATEDKKQSYETIKLSSNFLNSLTNALLKKPFYLLKDSLLPF